MNYQNKLLREIDDRRRRASNVILFNASENLTLDKTMDKHNDERAISEILNLTDISFEDSCIAFFRIGKPIAKSNVIRPLKIVFKSQEMAASFKEQIRRLKASPQPAQNIETINIADDRTPLRQQQLQALKRELSQKEPSDTHTWIIRFPGGIPRLVKVPKKPRE